MTLFGTWRRRFRQPASPPDSPSSLRASSSADAAGRAGRGRPVPPLAVRGLPALLFGLALTGAPGAKAQTTPTASVSISPTAAAEGDSGIREFNISLSLSAPHSARVNLQLCVSGTAADRPPFYEEGGGYDFDMEVFDTRAPRFDTRDPESCYVTRIRSGDTSETGYTLVVFGDEAIEDDETVVLTLKRHPGNNIFTATPAGVTVSSAPATFTILNDDLVPLPVSDPLVFSSAHISTNEPAACRDNASVEFGPVHATETYTVRLGSDPGGWARVTVFDPSDSRGIKTTPMRWGYAYKGRVTVTGDYPGYSSQPNSDGDGWVTELRFGSSNWYVPQTVTVNIHCARHDSGYRNKIWHRVWKSDDVLKQRLSGQIVTDTRDFVSTTVQVVDSAVPAEPADLSVASAYAGTLRPAIDTGTASPYPTPAGDEWEFQVSWSWETAAHPNDWWDASRHFSSFRTTVEADSSVTTPLEVSTYHEESDFVIDWDRTNNSAPYSETIWHTGLYYDRNSGANPGDPVYRLTFTPITARGSEVPGEAATICAQLQSPRATSPQAKKVVQIDCSLFVPQTANQVEATPPTLTIAADAAEIAEGGAVTFTVTADQAPGIDIAVNLGTSEEMGEGLNYVGFGQTGTVTIAADETSAAWTVTTYSDEVERADGTVTGRIKPSADYVLGEPSSVTLALLDDDGTDGGTADGGTTDGAKDGGAADGGTTDGAPEPPPVAQQSEPPGVAPALIAEVKAHIADFTARNHAMGIRDWTAILNRLEERDGGMSDGDIAAWLDNANRHGWQDGIDTLPKVQAALAALAAATQPADPTPVDPPADPPATPPPPPVPPADPPTDPQPTDPPPTSAVDPALIAEVKAHVADFTARNHAMGIRDWTAILNRLEGRAGGMGDGDIAAWLARSRQYGWQDGIDTLPKVQAALAALAAADSAPPPATPAVDPALVADVRAMAAQTHHGAAHVNRWRRVLMAFGEGSWPGLTPMTAADAEENARRHSSPLWPRIAELLAARESTSAVESAPPGGVSAQLLADVADRAGETHLGAEHVERWLRVLHTLEGAANDATIMLPAEARALIPLDPGRWGPVAEAIERLEARTFADALGN